ncbi:MAG: GAF domain-containing protein, partial [Anaerolineae bacterium]|nr:GAF domain-containing protein [Anaerolineae bacterium]
MSSLFFVNHVLEESVKALAHRFQTLGWPTVRIVILDEDGKPELQHTLMDDSCPLPEWSGEIPDEISRRISGLCEQVRIPVRSSAHELYGVVELSHPQDRSINPIQVEALADELALRIENQRLHDKVNALDEQVDELQFIRNADRELSSRLDPARIVKLALDWSMRRTGADAGAILTANRYSSDLEVRESFGYPPDLLEQVPWSVKRGIVGRAIRERSTLTVEKVQQDEDYEAVLPATVTKLVVPLISNRVVVGAIALESSIRGRFEPDAVGFVERIAGITAVALDNAQLLEQAEQMADDMSLIYNAGRTISSSLEWDKAIQSIAQGMALAVSGTSSLIYSYEPFTHRAQLQSIYSVTFSPEKENLPAIGTHWDFSRYASVRQAVKENRLVTLYADETDQDDEKQWLQELGTKAAAITPLTAQGEVIGIAVLLKSRPPYHYATSEIFVAESLSSQAASVLRQALLYTEISALENLKSEMIRMASHDLRSPIANATGYLELLDMELEGIKTEDMGIFMDSIRRSLKSMGNLVDNLLTLERVESQRNQPWEPLQFDDLIRAVFDELLASANLKHQQMVLEVLPGNYEVRGHRTQLQQAVANLVSNAIKYTPDEGRVTVRLEAEGETMLHFAVTDTGYGIPEDRQERIFQRFYR